MISKKKILRIIGVLFIITILFFMVGTPRYQSMKINNLGLSDFETQLKVIAAENSEIDINKLTSFQWDEAYIFTPYFPKGEIYKKVGTEWTTAKTFIGFLLFHSFENETVNDDQFVMVFKKDNKVVLGTLYNLSELPVIFKLDNYKFKNNNAKFLVRVVKQYDGGKIRELILKN